MVPARARPVPFCRHGFLPPPATSERVFLRSGSLTRARHISRHNLVNQRLVIFAGEVGLGDRYGPCCLISRLDYIQFHVSPPLLTTETGYCPPL